MPRFYLGSARVLGLATHSSTPGQEAIPGRDLEGLDSSPSSAISQLSDVQQVTLPSDPDFLPGTTGVILKRKNKQAAA